MLSLPLPFAKHKGAFVAGIAAITAAFASLIVGGHGYFAFQELNEKQRELELYAFELQQNNDELRRRVALLQDDARTIEHMARERLGLVHPDEVVYLVHDDTFAFDHP